MTEYYLQRKHSGYIGNSPTWWVKDGKGYSAYLQNAERFSEEAALKFIKEDSDKWAIFKCEEIDRRLHAIFDHQDMGKLSEIPEGKNGWGGNYISPDSVNSDVRQTTPLSDIKKSVCQKRDIREEN